jgi:hypothetical protein
VSLAEIIERLLLDLLRLQARDRGMQLTPIRRLTTPTTVAHERCHPAPRDETPGDGFGVAAASSWLKVTVLGQTDPDDGSAGL